MRKMIRFAALAVLPCLAGACAVSGWDAGSAGRCESIEMAVDAKGRPIEIEYHISPDQVPRAVQDAMSALYPGEEFTGAEHETHGGQLYWELTVTTGGYDVEAMFEPDGTLFSQEIEVPKESVLEPVQRAGETAFQGGEVTAWEEIRDGKQALTEYHVKIKADGKNYKVAISRGGAITSVVREVQAEIEVPAAR